jgi:putative redox protein
MIGAVKTVLVTWQPEADRFVAQGGIEGHAVHINAPHAGRPAGFSASELLLAAAGACSAWDVVEILCKQHQDLTALEIIVEGDQLDTPPFSFRTVELVFRATGHGLDAAKVQRAVALSEDRYCSVIGTIRGVARVTCRSEVAEAAA